MDSLPYIDQIHEDYEHYAASLIEEEMEKLDPAKSALKVNPLPPMKFRSAILQNEYKYVAETGETPSDRPTYHSDLQPPSDDSLASWEDAVKRAKIALEKERIRGTMLELEKEGVTAGQWKSFNEMLHNVGIEKVLKLQQQRVDKINIDRQEYQEHVGNDLYRLTSQYHQLVDKVYQLKSAVATMEDSVAALKSE